MTARVDRLRFAGIKRDSLGGDAGGSTTAAAAAATVPTLLRAPLLLGFVEAKKGGGCCAAAAAGGGGFRCGCLVDPPFLLALPLPLPAGVRLSRTAVEASEATVDAVSPPPSAFAAKKFSFDPASAKAGKKSFFTKPVSFVSENDMIIRCGAFLQRASVALREERPPFASDLEDTFSRFKISLLQPRKDKREYLTVPFFVVSVLSSVLPSSLLSSYKVEQSAFLPRSLHEWKRLSRQKPLAGA
jgi:hypothetical protein